MTEHVLILMFALLWLAERLGSYFRDRAHTRERRELYSRLQAGTLTNYTAQARKLEPEKRKPKEPSREPGPESPTGLFLDEKQTESVGAAGAAFSRLMTSEETNEA